MFNDLWIFTIVREDLMNVYVISLKIEYKPLFSFQSFMQLLYSVSRFSPWLFKTSLNSTFKLDTYNTFKEFFSLHVIFSLQSSFFSYNEKHSWNHLGSLTYWSSWWKSFLKQSVNIHFTCVSKEYKNIFF